MAIKPHLYLLMSALFFSSPQTHADDLNIAVASNFSHALHSLAEDFESKTGHRLRISSASTGKLYTQINHGAPFDIFLAADEHRPERLIAGGKASTEFSLTYAMGKLVFISNIAGEKNCFDVLDSTALKRLAIANPQTAPYGLAAQQTLEKLQRWQSTKAKLVMGENIAQTLQFVATGNASAGFVAQSMLHQGSKINLACEWPVHADMHEAINQKMLVLESASKKPAARAFWQYMQSEDARTIIKNSGYDVP
ncbi:MAG: molybdate ABC transporter substrate-binding protein [Gammaproteobacteria bacterium]|nr:molybdate ABC transporter substrate-binding protein [Gammaproteobacteria bacterium]